MSATFSLREDFKAVRKALLREASFICPDCDDGQCLRCFQATEAIRRISNEVADSREER